jgi:hypothetical protein
VGLRVGLDTEDREKNPLPLPVIEPMVGNVTIEPKVCILLYLNNITDSVLLRNVRKVGELLPS